LISCECCADFRGHQKNAAARKWKYGLSKRATNSSSFFFLQSFAVRAKARECAKKNASYVSIHRVRTRSRTWERSEQTRFRDRAGQRWKANAGPCFPAKGASTERTNSAPWRGLCQ